jgi:hypothetical protein
MSKRPDLSFVPIRDDKGIKVQAVFAVTAEDDVCVVTVAAKGGAVEDPDSSNTEYIPLMRLLLDRLRRYPARIVEIFVDSRAVEHLRVAERRVRIEGATYPLSWQKFGEIDELRKVIGRSVALVGRRAGSRGGGNSQKRLRIVTSVPGVERDALAAFLQLGA